MKIGIVGAMEPEVAILKNKLQHAKITEHANYRFYHGLLNGTDVVIVQSGIGKVAAALATAMLIEHFSPDAVVNTGSAGGFDVNLNIGDIVIGNEVRYHDVNLTAFGYDIGQLPANPSVYTADPDLVIAAQVGAKHLNDLTITSGLITTGDTFMADEDDIDKARKNFPTMVAVEMEGAAIAQTCLQFNIPCIVIRSLSDIAGKESPTSFEAYLETASINSSNLVINMLDALKEKRRF